MKELGTTCRSWVLIALAGTLAACGSPNSPSVSFTSPGVSGPLNGAAFAYAAQPITLAITNATVTSAATVTYSVDVATDNAFANKVVSKTGIPQASGATTPVLLPTLNGNQTYYWRAISVVNGASSPVTATSTFLVRPNVTLSVPIGASPSTVGTSTPTLTVIDAVRTGTPTGPIYYRFQIATDTAFSNVLADSGQIPEQIAQTSWTTTTALPASGTFYWHAQALDPSDAVTTAYSGSSTLQFQAGDGIDMRAAAIRNSPADLASWARTATITSVTYAPGLMFVDFDRRTGSNRWPDTPFGPGGSLEYTLGMCLNLHGAGKWYCSAPIQYWFGRANGANSNIGQTWFYDSARWGPMAGYQPQQGEMVGIFVGEGNLRNHSDDSGSVVLERSTILLIPFGQSTTTARLPTRARLISGPGGR